MRKALVVGINDYPECPLSGCINDAVQVMDLLARNEDGSKNFDVKLLTDVQSKDVLLDNIIELFKYEHEIALLYFSGHGYTNEFGGYIVTPDAGKYDAGVSMEKILKIVNESKCMNKIVFFDSCFSGAMGAVPVIGQEYGVIGKGVTILTACRDTETALEVNGHGVFTALLCEALRGGAANLQGSITPASIYSYIDQALGAWEQRPIFKTNTQSFVPIRKTNSRITRDDLSVLLECFKAEGDIMNLDPSFEDTNDLSVEHKVVEPYADRNHVKIFKKLQRLESVGIIEPLNENHMYFAAMNSTGCKLTELGKYYWKLLKEERI